MSVSLYWITKISSFASICRGKVEYVIDEHGSGPNEYGNVLDFALNPPR